MADTDPNVRMYRCPCGNQIPVAKQFVGRQVTCYACGKTLVIPSATGTRSGSGAGGADPSAVARPPTASAPAPVAQAPPMPATPPPQQSVVYVVQDPAGLQSQAARQVPAAHLSASVNMHLRSPVPEAERTIWEGRSSFAYYLPGMLWSCIWIVVWAALAVASEGIFTWLQDKAVAAAPAEARQAITNPDLKPVYLTAIFVLFALACVWGLIKKFLRYLNTYYAFTTQRLRLRQGVFSRAFHQMELYRVKDFAVVEPLWGRVFGYAHVRIVSSDRLASDVILMALPGGIHTVDKIRAAAQFARAETGVTTIHE
jgi:membrane protein YdbS with pleckstrin-like domain